MFVSVCAHVHVCALCVCACVCVQQHRDEDTLRNTHRKTPQNNLNVIHLFFETVSQWPGTCPLAKLVDQQNPRTHYLHLPALEFRVHNTSLNLVCWYWGPSSVPHVCMART